MDIHKKFKIATAILLLAGTMITFTGCGKKTTGPAVANNTQGGKYYLTGDINGSGFKANGKFYMPFKAEQGPGLGGNLKY